jgi:hypothetical protein
LYLSITNTAVNNKEELENIILKNTPQRAVQLKDISSGGDRREKRIY